MYIKCSCILILIINILIIIKIIINNICYYLARLTSVRPVVEPRCLLATHSTWRQQGGRAVACRPRSAQGRRVIAPWRQRRRDSRLQNAVLGRRRYHVNVVTDDVISGPHFGIERRHGATERRNVVDQIRYFETGRRRRHLAEESPTEIDVHLGRGLAEVTSRTTESANLGWSWRAGHVKQFAKPSAVCDDDL